MNMNLLESLQHAAPIVESLFEPVSDDELDARDLSDNDKAEIAREQNVKYIEDNFELAFIQNSSILEDLYSYVFGKDAISCAIDHLEDMSADDAADMAQIIRDELGSEAV